MDGGRSAASTQRTRRMAGHPVTVPSRQVEENILLPMGIYGGNPLRFRENLTKTGTISTAKSPTEMPAFMLSFFRPRLILDLAFQAGIFLEKFHGLAPHQWPIPRC